MWRFGIGVLSDLEGNRRYCTGRAHRSNYAPIKRSAELELGWKMMTNRTVCMKPVQLVLLALIIGGIVGALASLWASRVPINFSDSIPAIAEGK